MQYEQHKETLKRSVKPLLLLLLVLNHVELLRKQLYLDIIRSYLTRQQCIRHAQGILQILIVERSVIPDLVNDRLDVSVLLLAVDVVVHGAVEEVEVEDLVLLVGLQDHHGVRVLCDQDHGRQSVVQVLQDLLQRVDDFSIEVGLEVQDRQGDAIGKLELLGRLATEVGVVFLQDTPEHLLLLLLLGRVYAATEIAFKQHI